MSSVIFTNEEKNHIATDKYFCFIFQATVTIHRTGNMIIFAPSEEKIKQAVEYVAPLVEPFKNIKPKRRIKKKSSNQTSSKSRFLKEDPDQGNLLRGIVNWSGVARSVAQGQKHSLFYNFSNIFYFIST